MTDRLTDLLERAEPLADPVPFGAVQQAVRRRLRGVSLVSLVAAVAAAAIAVPLALNHPSSSQSGATVSTRPPPMQPEPKGVTLRGVSIPLPPGWQVGKATCDATVPYTVTVDDGGKCEASAREPSIVVTASAPLAVSVEKLEAGPCRSTTPHTVDGAQALLTVPCAGDFADLGFEAFGVTVEMTGLDVAQVDRVVSSISVRPRPLLEPPAASYVTVERVAVSDREIPLVHVRETTAVQRLLADIRALRPRGVRASGCPATPIFRVVVPKGPTYSVAVGDGCGYLTDGGGTLYATTPDLLAVLGAGFSGARP